MRRNLESLLGMNIDVLDFLRHSDVVSEDCIVDISDIRVDDKTLLGMAQRHDFDGIDDIAKSIRTQDEVRAYVDSYTKLTQTGYVPSKGAMETIATFIIENEMKVGAMFRPFYHELAKVSDNEKLLFDSVNNIINGKYDLEYMAKTVKALTNKVSNDEAILEMIPTLIPFYQYHYDQIISHKVGLPEYQGLLESMSSNENRLKAIGTILTRIYPKQSWDESFNTGVSKTEYLDFMKYVDSIGGINIYDEVAKHNARTNYNLSDAVRIYEALYDFKPELVEKQMKELLKMCFDGEIGHTIYHITGFFKEHNISYDSTGFIEKGDQFNRKQLREKKERYFNAGDSYYHGAGLDDKQVARRKASILKEEGFITEIPAFLRCNHITDSIVDACLDIAESGDFKTAMNELSMSKLDDQDMPDRFYKFIASSIMSLFVPRDLEPNLENLKTAYNRIKTGLLKNIDVTRDRSLSVNFTLDDYDFSFKELKIDGDKRNLVSIFVQNGFFEQNSVLKFYKSQEHAESEEFWTNALQDVVSVKKVLSSQRFGRIYVNQIEQCNGVPLIGTDYETVKEAIDLSFKIYEKASQHKDKATSVSKEFIEERVREFGIDAGWIYDVLKANEEGVIHHDYSTRNMMVEGGKLIPMDHESYVKGHPVGMAISMVKSHFNELSNQEEEELIEYARSKYPVSDEYVTAFKLLWNARQGKLGKVGSKRRNYHTNDMNWMFGEELRRAA